LWDFQIYHTSQPLIAMWSQWSKRGKWAYIVDFRAEFVSIHKTSSGNSRNI
jgi:hypothetical protein